MNYCKTNLKPLAAGSYKIISSFKIAWIERRRNSDIAASDLDPNTYQVHQIHVYQYHM